MTEQHLFEFTQLDAAIKECLPLKVAVIVTMADHCYTAFFDGRATYANLEDWDSNWGGFSQYVTVLLAKHCIKGVPTTSDTENCCSVNFGSIFDMIKNTAESNE